MAASHPPTKTPSSLSKSLLRRLDLYALAASAAGFGVAAQPAEAKIVYTPADVPIVKTVTIDLNHDGIVDAQLLLFPYGAEAFLTATSIGANRIWGIGHTASHLLAGVSIEPNPKKFAKGVNCGTASSRVCKGLNSFFDFSGSYSSRGPWAKFKNGYLGLKFYIQGKVHFGWARLHRATLGDYWVLAGYAYETVARKPILTGQKKGPDVIVQPASLGHLAQGASAIGAWRVKQTAMITH